MAEIQKDISFETWRYALQGSNSAHGLLLVVLKYMEQWSSEDLALVPSMAQLPPRDAEELSVQSLELSRADLTFRGPEAAHWRLREMALVISAAVARMRFLKSLS